MKRFLVVLMVMITSLIATASASASLSPNNVIGWPTSGQKPKAWVMVIHGGAWQGGANQMGVSLQEAYLLNLNGFGTYTIDYSSATPGSHGQQSYNDIIEAYDWIHGQVAAYNASQGWPMSAVGSDGDSSGAHWAMLVSVLRAQPFAISEAGPTYFLGYKTETANGSNAVPQANLTNTIEPIFGYTDGELNQWSPATYASSMCGYTKFMFLQADNDPIIPQAQAGDFMAKTGCAGSTTYTLHGGNDDQWIHSAVTNDTYYGSYTAEINFLNSVATSFGYARDRAATAQPVAARYHPSVKERRQFAATRHMRQPAWLKALLHRPLRQKVAGVRKHTRHARTLRGL